MSECQDMEKNLTLLMRGGEEIIEFCNTNRIEYWLNWGSLLGLKRHGNIIPWDNDLDLCMRNSEFVRFVSLFDDNKPSGSILSIDAVGYGEPEAVRWLKINGMNAQKYGIDIIAFDRKTDNSGQQWCCSKMSRELIDQYPDVYDFLESDIFPLQHVPFLGRLAAVPAKIIKRLVEAYGSEWQKYPDGRLESPLCNMPWRPTNVGKHSDFLGASSPVIVKQRGQYPKIYGNQIRLYWLLNAKVARQAQVNFSDFSRKSYTDIVFFNNRSLWGEVQMAVLYPGDELLVPADWFSVCRDIVYVS